MNARNRRFRRVIVVRERDRETTEVAHVRRSQCPSTRTDSSSTSIQQEQRKRESYGLANGPVHHLHAGSNPRSRGENRSVSTPCDLPPFYIHHTSIAQRLSSNSWLYRHSFESDYSEQIRPQDSCQYDCAVVGGFKTSNWPGSPIEADFEHG